MQDNSSAHSTQSAVLTQNVIDNRMIASMRLVLTAAALLIIYIDPSEPERFTVFSYATLSLYLGYSLVLWVAARRQVSLVPTAIEPWIDLGWSAILVGLSGGTNSIFFAFFLFAIIVASFRQGFASGLWVAFISALCFSAISWLSAPANVTTDLNRFLLRPVYLFIFGYLMAYWGENEIQLKKRLSLLRDISNLSNPRFGVDHTLGLLLERLRTFYNAEMCVLVTRDELQGDCHLRRVDLHNPESGVRSELISAELAAALLALSDDQRLIYRGEPYWWERPWVENTASSVAIGHGSLKWDLPRIGALLSATSFVTASMPLRGTRSGRLYVTSQHRSHFLPSDCDFIAQMLDQVVPTIENIDLIDRLVSEAAETERRRIVLDMHDSVMQPYIGLKMGLTTVREKLIRGNTDVTDDVERLIEMTNIGFGAVNRNIQKLKQDNAGEFSLTDAIRRFGLKFSKASEFEVVVEAKDDLDINDRLAAEVLQIVVEGLSNIRRHTQSTRACISLARLDNHLKLRITNARWTDATFAPFMPRSIVERTAALGGQVHVVQAKNGNTVVEADIPL